MVQCSEQSSPKDPPPGVGVGSERCAQGHFVICCPSHTVPSVWEGHTSSYHVEVLLTAEAGMFRLYVALPLSSAPLTM